MKAPKPLGQFHVSRVNVVMELKAPTPREVKALTASDPIHVSQSNVSDTHVLYHYLCNCRENINPHTAFDDETLTRLLNLAKMHSPKAHALVQLLYGGALRI